jgi:hypothetical protein
MLPRGRRKGELTVAAREARRAWAELMVDPAPAIDYDRRLASARIGAARPPPMRAGILDGLDESLAARTAQGGPDTARAFFSEMGRVLAAQLRIATLVPGRLANSSVLCALALRSIAQACGSAVPAVEGLDAAALLRASGTEATFSAADQAAVAFLSLEEGAADEVASTTAFAARRGGGDPLELAHVLAVAVRDRKRAVPAAWDGFLRAFPRTLGKTTQWRHLLLAAATALGKLGGVAPGEVGAAVHAQVRTLAAGETP